ncbi:MAG: glycosyltransferase family 1 protein [Candidatus Moraniibacteriota bacterium]
MRIGIDLRALTAGKHTGVEEYTRGLLRSLFELDRENEYILFWNAWREVDLDLGWALTYPNVSVRRFHFPNKLLNLSLWYLQFPKLDRLIGGVDVFFMPNLNFAAFSRGVKVIVTAHDLSFEYFPETFSWKHRVWHYLINFRALLRRADVVLSVSHSTADDLVRVYGLPREKIHVIMSGVDERFIPVSRNDPRLFAVKEKYRLPYHFILYLGTIEPRKNIEALLSAYEVFQKTSLGEGLRYELVLAGSSGWKNEELLEKIEHSPVREKIHLIGFVDDADKPALYNLASVFVYPSLYEGFGFPPLEALSCGVPTIVSHSSSLPEVVGEAGILIDPYRPDEILQAIRQLLQGKSLQEELRRQAALRKRYFNWFQAAQGFLDVLRGA